MIRYFPYLLALLWFAVRLAGGAIVHNDYERGKSIGITANLIFILLIILYSLYQTLKSNTTNTFLDDFRLCIKAALKYIFLMTLLMVIYYTTLSDELADIRTSAFAEAVLSLDTDEELARARSENFALKDLSREEILDGWKRNIDLFHSIKAIAIGGSLVLILIAFLYSALGTWLWRTILGKKPEVDHKLNGKTS